MSAKSFIEYSAETEFPLENIPFGVFRKSANEKSRCASIIGDFVVDLYELVDAGLLKGEALGDGAVLKEENLNAFMGLTRPAWREARATIQSLLSADNATLRDNAELRARVLLPASSVELLLPCRIGDYTDFYASKEHASNVGTMFRGKDNALMPNWVWLPVGYHGRASSVVVSGHSFPRPSGQTKADTDDAPKYTPCRLLDFELEMGFFVGTGNKQGDPISMEEAEDKIFGVVLMNDWSARDIQKWEYVPLGPFGAKNFCTTISPWIVTLDALEPFRCPQPKQDPAPLEYLKDSKDSAYDINLSVAIKPKASEEAFVVCNSNLKYMYWTLKQQLVHHTVTGCNMQPGDLLGTGTISGPERENFGSMLEISWRGTNPLTLPNGEQRKFLADGDDVQIRGFCKGEGYKVGFGACDGTILPARQ
uniref:Fumarylacetoacetase n=1 Tax=Palpitomonas bilix TaxID=652834 RepID=A0A7S3FYR0_9EUKA|mmetsp:Transcript_14436/g.36803  ORF Transcript_14436/g.36803 Transcript_14436/m.36803 type:complete len:422 (+) Transcript_14436:39-1304(+)